ncbi:hypothetical protein AVEN_173923-1, partial [Araneus ventricosus]
AYTRVEQPTAAGSKKSIMECYRTAPYIPKVIDRSIRTISRTGTLSGILRSPHHWKQVIHNARDYIEEL